MSLHYLGSNDSLGHHLSDPSDEEHEIMNKGEAKLLKYSEEKDKHIETLCQKVIEEEVDTIAILLASPQAKELLTILKIN